MLVLLVIFIVTAPMIKPSIDVDLPRGQGTGKPGQGVAPFAIVVDEQGRTHVGSEIVELADVEQKLPPLLQGHAKEPVSLRAHRRLSYEAVVRVMCAMRAAGISGIDLAVDSSQEAGQK
jgi:biopolymer transport protein ExbD